MKLLLRTWKTSQTTEISMPEISVSSSNEITGKPNEIQIPSVFIAIFILLCIYCYTYSPLNLLLHFPL